MPDIRVAARRSDNNLLRPLSFNPSSCFSIPPRLRYVSLKKKKKEKKLDSLYTFYTFPSFESFGSKKESFEKNQNFFQLIFLNPRFLSYPSYLTNNETNP